MSNIGESYMAIGNDSIALVYLNSAIAKRQQMSSQSIVDKIMIGDSYVSIASIYQKRGDFLKALDYFKLALKTGKEVNNIETITNAYSHLGELYAERHNDTEALKMFLLGVEAAGPLQDNAVTAEFFFAIGGCYTRLQQYVEAKKYFEDALELAGNAQNESLSYLYYEGVELIDSATGNWKDAYIHYKNAVRLKSKLNIDEESRKMVQTIMQLEFENKEAAAKAEQERKDMLQRTVRNTIAAILAGSLIFLFAVIYQRNKISKARKRSDELLLNILPADVAEELKAKGTADAKQFDEVTVMFTDFKGFTQLSEKLTPSELVSEIHTCFKAFDNIIGKYNIEKIKTIGDAYMAAGGLPVTNTTNAIDVVYAALEIIKFMQQHKLEREQENKPVFEIRIGVHTGPVVAGIVGVRKFAYDIWGDTVNIASRMESSGEAGKVNISGTVYERVKDTFHCAYRGKIQAKNKGEIDMYFVEG
jgi:class 3 adenylate cyclase